MPKKITITGYQCEHCNAVFLSLNEAKICQKRCADNLRIKQEREMASKIQKQYRMKVKKISDIPDMLTDFVRDIYGIEGVTVVLTNMRYKECLSNTHSCPIGGVKNWRQENNLPKGYPGFGGHIHVAYDGTLGEHGNEFDISMITGGFGRYEEFKGINAGSGGGSGGATYQYSVSIFLSDFPELQKAMNLSKLKGKEVKSGMVDVPN